MTREEFIEKWKSRCSAIHSYREWNIFLCQYGEEFYDDLQSFCDQYFEENK